MHHTCDENKHEKLSKVTSYSLEHKSDGKKLRKQAVVTSVSTGCLASIACEVMPKITVTMRPLNRSVHQLVKEDIELRPGQRPPTPARQSLPNLLPVGTKPSDNSPKGESWLSVSGEVCRIPVVASARSASPPGSLQHHQRSLSSDLDLSASTRSEGWTHAGSGGVVHLPPISKSRSEERHKDNRFNVAKKTLEQLDTLLPSDDSIAYRHPHTRHSMQTHI